MSWYRWSSESAFDSWQTAACTALGIPHAGQNAATGELDPDAQWTTAYTAAVHLGFRDWRAWVADDVAELVPAGLGTPTDPPPTPDE